MNKSPDSFFLIRRAIESSIGKIAIGFSRADFMLGGVEDEVNFGPLQIKFSDGYCLTLDECGDAESISGSNNPIDFGTSEEKEYWKEIRLNSISNFSEFVNCKIVQVRFLKDSLEGQESTRGCSLYFDNGKFITYFNYYDDSKVAFDGSELLDSFIQFENLKWVD
jgi:hypothetical protein